VKTEVYSWRVSSDLKSELEREAHLRKTSISAIVDSAVRGWLQANTMNLDEAAEQRRLHRAAAGCIGIVAGRKTRRAETARASIRERLGRRHAR